LNPRARFCAVAASLFRRHIPKPVAVGFKPRRDCREGRAV